MTTAYAHILCKKIIETESKRLGLSVGEFVTSIIHAGEEMNSNISPASSYVGHGDVLDYIENILDDECDEDAIDILNDISRKAEKKMRKIEDDMEDEDE